MVVIGDWYHKGDTGGWDDESIRKRCMAGTFREHEAYIAAGYILRPESPAVNSLDSLAKQICSKYSITLEVLKDRKKHGSLGTEARGEFCYLASSKLSHSNKVIGYFLGDRDPSSVSYLMWHYAEMTGQTVPKRVNTHCKNGHEWNEENTMYERNGHRKCRQCRRQYQTDRRGRRVRGGTGQDLPSELAAINKRLVARVQRTKHPLAEGEDLG